MKVRRVLTDNIFKVLCNFCFMTSSNFIELEMKLTDTFLELNVTPKVDLVLFRCLKRRSMWMR